MEQFLSLVDDHVQFDGGTTCTLAIDRDTVWVTTKGTDILVNPSERLYLVQDSSIEVTIRRIRELWRRKEAKGIEAVVHRHNNDVGALVDPTIEWPVPWVPIDITSERSWYVSIISEIQPTYLLREYRRVRALHDMSQRQEM